MKPAQFTLICTSLLFLVGCKVSADAELIDFSPNKSSVKSTDFSLYAGEREIFIEQYKTYYYAHFEFGSSLGLSLKSANSIKKFEISPHSYGIKGTQDENTIHFSIERPGFVLVRINDDQRIFIFADPPQMPLPSETISILEYEIDLSGNDVQTSKLQTALDEISGSGKVLVFPAGIYKTGLLSIKSNTKIHLSPGAVILGPDDISELRFEENSSPKGFIRIKDAENVEISGRGIIDANGRHLRNQFGDDGRCRALLILNSGKVTIDGIILRNSGSWNTQILHSEDVSITNIKMLNDIDLSNTDGFDPDASKRVLIENCFAYCGDDNVAIKSTNTSGYLQDVEDITVRGCVFLTKKSALKVGTESLTGVMKNITFENNDVLECDRGMTLYCYDGASYENIRYLNNRFERNHPDRNQCGIHFWLKGRNQESKIGTMNQILIRDCSFSTAFPNPFLVRGYDENHKIDLKIENLTVAGEACSSGNESTFFSEEFADISYE